MFKVKEAHKNCMFWYCISPSDVLLFFFLYNKLSATLMCHHVNQFFYFLFNNLHLSCYSKIKHQNVICMFLYFIKRNGV